MKLRLRHNRIRLRLGKSEVAQLQCGGECREEIHFPGGVRFIYAIRPSPTGTGLNATLCGSLIRIDVPEEDLVRWCTSDQVGISAAVTLSDSAPLEILIEKDFRCLDPLVPEDQSDTFDNPIIRHDVCE
jgi:hypothetical protein